MTAGPDPLFLESAAQLREIREARLAATLDRVFAAHPHYRARFAKIGLERYHLRGIDGSGVRASSHERDRRIPSLSSQACSNRR